MTVGLGDSRPAGRERGLAWLAYLRAQLRGDLSVLPPADVAREQMVFDPDPDPEF